MSVKKNQSKKRKEEIQEFQLSDKQEPHVDRMLKMLGERHFVFDNTDMGGGKTIMHLYVAKQFELPVLVICGISAMVVWTEETEKYGIEMVDMISYPSMASRTGCQPKHGLLQRVDRIIVDESGKKTKKHPEFIPTKKLIDLVKSGVYVIFDEYQTIRNTNTYFYACQAVARCIMKTEKCESRFALLSGAPIVEQEQTVNMMKFAGVITEYFLYKYHRESFTLELIGAKQLLNYCKAMDSKRTQESLKQYPVPEVGKKKEVIEFCHRLYVNVLLYNIRSAAPSPDIDVELDVKNGYYKLPEENQRKLKDALERLANELEFDEETKTYRKANGLSMWTRESVVIEENKISIFKRLSLNHLTSTKGKVIIMLNHLASVTQLEEMLADYNPLVMIGEVKENKTQKKRTDIIKKFRNDGKYRVLIGTSQVLAYTFNLQDLIGDAPRLTLYSPNFFTDRLHQAIKRSYRWGTKSPCVFRNIYGESECRLESSIIAAHFRKTPNMKDHLPEQVDQGSVFPGDYEEEIEH